MVFYMFEILSYLSFAILVLLFIFFLIIIIGWRKIVKNFINKASKIIFTDSYQENLLELMPGLRHICIQNVLDNKNRYENGSVLKVTTFTDHIVINSYSVLISSIIYYI